MVKLDEKRRVRERERERDRERERESTEWRARVGRGNRYIQRKKSSKMLTFREQMPEDVGQEDLEFSTLIVKRCYFITGALHNSARV
jgi:hypothetical protein